MTRGLKDQLIGLDPRFRYRGLNQTRVETFSDVGFALAITLIVLSASVPETFVELKESMSGVLPFFLCVILLVIIWMQHYMFFLRYGLQDTRTIVYNTVLLFLILVYVYPLKFLMTFLVTFYTALITGTLETFQSSFTMQSGDMKFLMIIYGLGAGLIFYTLAALNRHALKLKVELDLDEYEVFQTKGSISVNVLLGSIPMLSCLVAWLGSDNSLTYAISGFMYLLYPIIMPLHGRYLGIKKERLFPEK
ncbi:MAG: DUF1211 domain-containing protein [Cytophagales bacterium]|nr:DUF1211 domain-containing protein [Cytophagales bacterium]